MMDWLTEHGWVQESNSSFGKVVSFLAFVSMPGCFVGAIIERLFWNK